MFLNGVFLFHLGGTQLPEGAYGPYAYFKFLVKELTWQVNYQSILGLWGFPSFGFSLQFLNAPGTLRGRLPQAPAGGLALEARAAPGLMAAAAAAALC